MKRRELLLGAAGAGMLAQAQGPGPVRPADPLQMVMSDGSTFDLAQQKGKVVVIEILLTHCPACQQNARLLSRIQEEYADRGVKCVGMAINTAAAMEMPDFVRRWATGFPVGIKTLAFAQGWLQVSAVRNLLTPRLVFVDRKGMIRAHYGAEEKWMEPSVEEKNIRALLNQLVSEPAGVTKKSGAGKKKAS